MNDKYVIDINNDFILNIFKRVNELLKTDSTQNFYKILHISTQQELESLFKSYGINVKSHNTSSKRFNHSPNIINLDNVNYISKVTKLEFNQEHPFHFIYDNENYDKSQIDDMFNNSMIIKIFTDGVFDEKTIIVDEIEYTIDEDNNYSFSDYPKYNTVRINDIFINEESDFDRVDETGQLYIYNQMMEVKNGNWYINGVNLSSTDKVLFNEIDVEEKEKVTFDFCESYGITEYSIHSLNYLQKTVNNESFSSFKKFIQPFLGNYLIYIDNDDYSIEINTNEDVKLVSYCFDISKKKRGSYIGLFGLCFDEKLFKNISIEITNTLIEINTNFSQYPMLYQNQSTGEIYTCMCFKDTFDDKNKIFDKSIKYKKQICDYCNKTIPKYDYGSIYHSLFRQKYETYHQMLLRKKYNSTGWVYRDSKEENDEIENQLREHFGYHKIGEKWVSETLLFKMTCLIFGEENVIFHYRGTEMEGLEIDIWVSNKKIGIEYQGIQHYKSIENWGGEKGFQKRQENDKKKKELMKKNGYTLIEYRYDEEITESLLEKKLKGYI